MVFGRRMLLSAPLGGFSSGIGVQAFDECIDFENQNVMQFTLKAKVAANRETIGCEVSVLGVGDKSIVVAQPSEIEVTIK